MSLADDERARLEQCAKALNGRGVYTRVRAAIIVESGVTRHTWELDVSGYAVPQGGWHEGVDMDGLDVFTKEPVSETGFVIRHKEAT
jgi:hypothetical protein